MQVTGLFHVAIKTNDLDATVKFYTEVLGMTLVHRPGLRFSRRLDRGGRQHPDHPHLCRRTGARRRWQNALWHPALDHVGLTIKGWDECLERVKKLGYDWRAAIVPGTSLWQMAFTTQRRDDGIDLRRQSGEPADAGNSCGPRLYGRQAVRSAEAKAA